MTTRSYMLRSRPGLKLATTKLAALIDDGVSDERIGWYTPIAYRDCPDCKEHHAMAMMHDSAWFFCFRNRWAHAFRKFSPDELHEIIQLAFGSADAARSYLKLAEQ